MKRDPQAERLYKLENESMLGQGLSGLSQRAVRTLVDAIAKTFDTSRPGIRFAKTKAYSGLWLEGGVLVLSTWEKTISPIVVIHEMAHHLHDALAPENKHQDHGPQFMCCYMAILDTTRFIPVSGMKAMCKEARLRYIDPGRDVSLPTLKRRVLHGTVE